MAGNIQRVESKYANEVIDHFNNPRNVGKFVDGKNIGTSIVGAPACGDVLKFQIKVGENNEIVDAKFQAFGCGSAIASSSLATELVKGKTIEDSLRVSNDQIAKKLSLPPVKLHCSMLVEDAIKSAINNYKLKNSLS